MLIHSSNCKLLTLILFLLCLTSINAKIKRKSERTLYTDYIEEVETKRLEKLLDDTPYIAVFFYTLSGPCDNCKEILVELEKIDDDADKYKVQMVKNSDKAEAKKYGVTKFPALVYFRHREPTAYKGDLMNEDDVLEWLTRQHRKDL